MSARSFFLRLLLGIAVIVGMLGLFNGLIDHSRLFGSPGIVGLNYWKPFFFAGQFTAKPYRVRQVKPDALILGTSRAGASLSTEHRGWEGYRAYNFALAGTTAEIQWWNFRHATAVGAVRKGVLALDFMMFNSCRQQGREAHFAEYQQRLHLNSSGINWRYPVRFLVDHLRALTSVESTRLSWLTWRAQADFAQADNGHLHLQEDGYWQRFPARRESVHQGFVLTERNYIRDSWFPAPNHCYSLAVVDGQHQLGYMRLLLDLAYGAGTEMHIYFSPFHARFADAMAAAGLWSEFEQLKREVLFMNLELAKKYAVEPFPLWDFSGYNSVSTEVIPKRGDKLSRMQYFIDGTHSTRLTGDMVQDRLFGTEFASASTPADFGLRLQPETVEAALSRDRRLQLEYQAAHPGQTASLRAMAKKYGRN